MSQLKKFPRKIKTFNYTQTLQKLLGPFYLEQNASMFDIFQSGANSIEGNPNRQLQFCQILLWHRGNIIFHTIYLLGTIVSDKQYRYLDRKNIIRDNLTLSWIISHFYLH